MSESVALLRNTYALINNINLNPIDPDLNTYFFIKSNDLPRYIKENNSTISDDDIISVIDPNINNIYWNNRKLLNISNLENLTEYIKLQPIEFVQLDRSPSEIQVYYLDGYNVNYNILYIKVKDFIKEINNNKSITIKFPKADIYIKYQYELYDFYNNTTNKVENFISR
jgi:hypothetical protein